MGKYFKQIIFLLFFLNHLGSLANGPTLHFQRYSADDGMAHGRINCIAQDEEGFMWFGTNNGLSKFNGYEFINYLPGTNDSIGLFGQKINSLYIDSKNRLWIASGNKGGLYVYNKHNDSFINYLYNPVDKPLTFVVYDITEDDKGNIWAGTTEGLCLIDPNKQQEPTWFINKDDKKENFGYKNVFSIYFDSQQRLWAGTRLGLFIFDKTKNKLTQIFTMKEKPVRMESIVEYSTNIILVATRGNGLFFLEYNNINSKIPVIQKSIHITNNPEEPNSLKSNFINSIHKEKNGSCWICTDNGLSYLENNNEGLTSIDSFSFQTYVYDPHINESLNYDFVRCAFRDKSDVLWVGTNTGLNKSKNYKFKHYNQQKSGTQLCSNKVQAFYEEGNGTIWIGTSKGVNLFNKENGSISTVLSEFEAILSICKDVSTGVYWLTSWETGIIKYNPDQKYIKLYTNEKRDSGSIEYGNANKVFIDNEGNIWVSIWSNGLYLYDRKNDKFVKKIPTPESNRITVIYEDKENKLWIGSLQELLRIENKHTTEFSKFKLLQGNLIKTDHIFIKCIAEDNFGQMWIGTDMGLFKKNEDNSFNVYTTKDGLPSNIISGIVTDKNENLWISTLKGLCKMSLPHNQANDSTHKSKIKVFYTEQGIQGKEFVPNAYYRCKSGEILFGGTNGFNLFDPNLIHDNEIKPNIAFTGFSLFNNRISVGEKINKNIILKQPISVTEEITLFHNQNIFTIWFAALHFVAPQKNKYSYLMEGIDKKWNLIGSERKVTFIGLKPGKYVFKLKASNSDGVWNNNFKKLKITIIPPWWQTVWFRILLVGFLLYIIYLILKTRTRMLKKQKLLLEQTVEQRTSELKELNLVLEERQEEIETMALKLHEADQKQLRFFTNISHEFRTPLTLIIGPMQKYVKIPHLKHVHEWGNIHRNLHLVLRNAQRLLRLVNQIIDFRKLDLGNIKINASQNNIEDFIKDLVSSFKTLAESKGIKLGVKSEEQTVKSEELRMNNEEQVIQSSHSSLITQFWFDPDIIEKILSNLISNAIKYTPEGGQVLITMDVAVETHGRASLPNNQMVIKITDTGIGINPEEQNKIFDRFYRSDNKGENDIEGTGIGLAYTKELVNLHNGEIKVQSEPGKGTSFVLSFDIHSKQKSNIPEKTQTRNYKLSLHHKETMDSSTIGSIHSEINNKESKPESDKYIGLIVEDNDDMRHYIFDELKETFRVYSAKDGLEGFEVAIQKYPDFIVSDIMMPRMDGIEMCRKIKGYEDTSHIPVILLTALTGEENVIKALKTNADDYINKPFNTRILIAKIENLLLIRKQLREKFNLSGSMNPKDFSPGPIDEIFLKRAIEIVEKNLSNTELTNEKFISLLKYSRAMVYKKIKTLTDLSVSGFIQNIRLKKAAQLLVEGNYNISEVSLMVGYKYRESFYRNFTAMFGKSPTQFIKDNQSTDPNNIEGK